MHGIWNACCRARILPTTNDEGRTTIITIGVLALQGDFDAHRKGLPVSGLATFVELSDSMLLVTPGKDRPRLEDVASGYWTPSIKRSSGLVSHYGSTPSSSADLSTKAVEFAIVELIDGVPIGILPGPG